MKLAVSDVPEAWRAPLALIVFLLLAGAGGVAAYAGVEAAVAKAADAAVARRWTDVYQEQALRACTSAADQGAYRAVSEAMRETVIPIQTDVALHAERIASIAARIDRLENLRPGYRR